MAFNVLSILYVSSKASVAPLYLSKYKNLYVNKSEFTTILRWHIMFLNSLKAHNFFNSSLYSLYICGLKFFKSAIAHSILLCIGISVNSSILSKLCELNIIIPYRQYSISQFIFINLPRINISISISLGGNSAIYIFFPKQLV